MKWNLPPLYMPSSGSIVRVKLSVSSGSGKSVFIVLGRASSERSESRRESARNRKSHDVVVIPFWTRSCAAVTFFFLVPAAASAFASCCCFCFCR